MKLGCDCGFVAQGAGSDELVAVAQAHARDAHLVDLTAEVILTLADPTSPLHQPAEPTPNRTDRA